MQPAYLPWLGFFHRAALADLLIVLDDVQIDRNSKTGFAHRNRVRTQQGSTWLTIPLRIKGKHGAAYLHELEPADDQPWRVKHLQTLRHAYGRTPYFAAYAERLAEFYERRDRRLIDVLRASMEWQFAALGLTTPVVYASTLDVEGTKDERILNLCRRVGATTYVSGPFGRDYLRDDSFNEAGIEIVYHDYVHPTYPQAYPDFEPFMAAVDLLFNCGPESLRILSGAAEGASR